MLPRPERDRTWLLGALLGLFLLCVSPASAQDISEETGDTTKGKRVFNRCRACHVLTADAPTRLGPHLEGLFDRRVGSVPGYRYSRALRDADFVWTDKDLDAWLMAPNTFLPGNRMSFQGLRRAEDRKNLIAYLRASLLPTDRE